MNTVCPHCQQDMSLNEAQQAKVRTALANLPAGKTLKIACPKCKQPVELSADGSQTGKKGRPRRTKGPLDPPAPPDLEWMKHDEFTQKEIIEDIPLVLILMEESPERQQVEEAFSGLGFRTELSTSAAKAIEGMRFVDYAAIVLHSRLEGDSLEQSQLHDYILKLPMSKRRYIVYILIGPEFKTMYDLQALCNSANLVVNDNEVPMLDIILKKTMHEYELFYAPYLEALREHGKK